MSLKNSRLQSWLLVLLWAGLIFGSSTSAFGGRQTASIVIPILHFLLPSAGPDTLDLLHEFIRKCAHFVNYAVLGVLLFRALRAPHKGWALRWALWAVLIAGTYACSDEYHQSFEAGRGPSAMDALLDTTGASAGQVVTWLFLRNRRRQSAPADS